MNLHLSLLLAGLLLAGCAPVSPAVTPEPPPRPVQVATPIPPTYARDASVAHLQSALRTKGYRIRVDGVCGRETQRAVADYQINLGVRLQSDGHCRVGGPTRSGLGMGRGEYAGR